MGLRFPPHPNPLPPGERRSFRRSLTGSRRTPEGRPAGRRQSTPADGRQEYSEIRSGAEWTFTREVLPLQRGRSRNGQRCTGGYQLDETPAAHRTTGIRAHRFAVSPAQFSDERVTQIFVMPKWTVVRNGAKSGCQGVETGLAEGGEQGNGVSGGHADQMGEKVAQVCRGVRRVVYVWALRG